MVNNTKAPKERGIIFNAEMVRAILDGRKTQTRSVMKVQPVLNGKFYEVYGAGWSEKIKFVPAIPGHSLSDNCPFGSVGDRLWVRETSGLQVRRDAQGGTGEFRVYRASNPDAIRFTTASGKDYPIKWVPSIHMPRHASRILLEVTSVRVERLNEISEEDAISEGVGTDRLAESQDNYDCIADCNMTGRPTAKGCFSDLWQSIYGAESWLSNPWVWVVEFRVLERTR